MKQTSKYLCQIIWLLIATQPTRHTELCLVKTIVPKMGLLIDSGLVYLYCKPLCVLLFIGIVFWYPIWGLFCNLAFFSSYITDVGRSQLNAICQLQYFEVGHKQKTRAQRRKLHRWRLSVIFAWLASYAHFGLLVLSLIFRHCSTAGFWWCER